MDGLSLEALLRLAPIVVGWVRAWQKGDNATLQAVDTLLLTPEERKAADEALTASLEAEAAKQLRSG